MKPYYVLGLDVGYSAKRASSGVFLGAVRDRVLYPIEGPFNLEQSAAHERALNLLQKYGVRVVAIDAALAEQHQFTYRAIESVFSLGQFQKHCKPGNTASPVGQKLHAAGMLLVKSLGSVASYAPLSQLVSELGKFDGVPILEVFPTAALGVLVASGAAGVVRRRTKSDIYFKHLSADHDSAIGCIGLAPSLHVKNHDQRMAIVAAALASCYVEGRSSVIGETASGYFLMPHIDDWLGEWRSELFKNLKLVPSVVLLEPSGLPA
jgi:predicted nuclease with RNAse H fold